MPSKIDLDDEINAITFAVNQALDQVKDARIAVFDVDINTDSQATTEMIDARIAHWKRYGEDAASGAVVYAMVKAAEDYLTAALDVMAIIQSGMNKATGPDTTPAPGPGPDTPPAPGPGPDTPPNPGPKPEPQMFDFCWSCEEADVMCNDDGECPHCYVLLTGWEEK